MKQFPISILYNPIHQIFQVLKAILPLMLCSQLVHLDHPKYIYQEWKECQIEKVGSKSFVILQSWFIKNFYLCFSHFIPGHKWSDHHSIDHDVHTHFPSSNRVDPSIIHQDLNFISECILCMWPNLFPVIFLSNITPIFR